MPFDKEKEKTLEKDKNYKKLDKKIKNNDKYTQILKKICSDLDK